MASQQLCQDHPLGREGEPGRGKFQDLLFTGLVSNKVFSEGTGTAEGINQIPSAALQEN